MKKLYIVTPDEKIISSVKSVLKDISIETSDNFPQNPENYDLIALSDYYETSFDFKAGNIIRLHKSLLPSFNTKTPVKDAYLAGVKVTGITIHRVENPDNTGLILAQYPIMIDHYTNFGQLAEEINQLSYKIFPLVIKSILEDKLFDIVDFLSDSHCSGCKSGKCGNCNGECK